MLAAVAPGNERGGAVRVLEEAALKLAAAPDDGRRSVFIGGNRGDLGDRCRAESNWFWRHGRGARPADATDDWRAE